MKKSTSRNSLVVCPSAQANWQGSVAIGVVGGTADEPRVTHFSNALAITEALIALSKPVTPGEVFRFAAPCRCTACVHFETQECRLAKRIVRLLPPVTDQLPVCPVRPQCRWWQQEGTAACLRCAQVVTDNYNPSEVMREAAIPV